MAVKKSFNPRNSIFIIFLYHLLIPLFFTDEFLGKYTFRLPVMAVKKMAQNYCSILIHVQMDFDQRLTAKEMDSCLVAKYPGLSDEKDLMVDFLDFLEHF